MPCVCVCVCVTPAGLDTVCLVLRAGRNLLQMQQQQSTMAVPGIAPAPGVQVSLCSRCPAHARVLAAEPCSHA